LQTLKKHLEALESGTLKEEDREAVLEETGDMFQTVKRMVQEVPLPVSRL